MEAEKTVYPSLTIAKIKNPNRAWAIPIFGGLAKIIILIPVFVEIAVLMLYVFLLQIINSFYVLFKKEYWPYCFSTTCGTLNLIAKTSLFFSGLTDEYPGFNLKLNGDFDLKFTIPKKPGAFFAIPVLGGIARGILIIPFAIYSQVISNGSRIGMVGSSVPVLLNGRYPDSTYELISDALRLSLSETAYFAGISDKYPSFKINMNHQTIKIFLIIIGTILVFSQWKFNHKQNNVEDGFKDKPPFIRNIPNRNSPPNYYNYR